MKELLERCAGLDVHKKSVTVCIMIGFGENVIRETRTFGTTTPDILELAQWLKSKSVKDIAMESSGIYWKPFFNLLEADFDITLANARNIKNVPGRKTDAKDAEWICKLFKCGLIEKSFIPEEEIRDLRDVTRYRRSLSRAVTAEKNRVIKILESANIKISSVFSDVYGKTSWNIIKMIIAGETDVNKLTANIPKSVKTSIEEIKKALTGTIKRHHRDILSIMVSNIESIEMSIDAINKQIEDKLTKFSEQIKLLETVPGVAKTVASIIIAEIGVDMNQFPTAQHLASWAGLCPGNNESAGKKKAQGLIQETHI